MMSFRDIPLPVGWLRPYAPILSGTLFLFWSIFKVVHPAVTVATEAMQALLANDHQVRDTTDRPPKTEAVS